MNTHFKEQIERLSPAQQDQIARSAAQRVSWRMALLRQTRSCRGWQHLPSFVMAGACGIFIPFPSIRPWVLLVSVVVLSGVILAINQRLDAITELLEQDIKRAAEQEAEER